MTKVGVLVFPGSNCDQDCYYVIHQLFRQEVAFIWHQETRLNGFQAIVLPGGFSYGDYLRCGAIARFSPIMKAVRQFAKDGGLVLGICNGFQILLEADLLPGAMLRNQSLKFVCRQVHLRVENGDTPYTRQYCPQQILKLPIAHGDGNYYVDAEILERMKQNHQIVFRYCQSDGRVDRESNPNGSVENIAGICNEQGNVLGMMPHPERASELALGSRDGRGIFDSLFNLMGSS
jgi:phosphoribosylformylglycinamidine synthase subunit PurQ / glutaminase